MASSPTVRIGAQPGEFPYFAQQRGLLRKDALDGFQVETGTEGARALYETAKPGQSHVRQLGGQLFPNLHLLIIRQRCEVIDCPNFCVPQRPSGFFSIPGTRVSF